MLSPKFTIISEMLINLFGEIAFLDSKALSSSKVLNPDGMDLDSHEVSNLSVQGWRLKLSDDEVSMRLRFPGLIEDQRQVLNQLLQDLEIYLRNPILVGGKGKASKVKKEFGSSSSSGLKLESGNGKFQTFLSSRPNLHHLSMKYSQRYNFFLLASHVTTKTPVKSAALERLEKNPSNYGIGLTLTGSTLQEQLTQFFNKILLQFGVLSKDVLIQAIATKADIGKIDLGRIHFFLFLFILFAYFLRIFTVLDDNMLKAASSTLIQQALQSCTMSPFPNLHIRISCGNEPFKNQVRKEIIQLYQSCPPDKRIVSKKEYMALIFKLAGSSTDGLYKSVMNEFGVGSKSGRWTFKDGCGDTF